MGSSLGKKKGSERTGESVPQMKCGNLDCRILVVKKLWKNRSWKNCYWGWWPCKPWRAVHFKVSNTRERKWYPTRTVKHTITTRCVLVDRSCRCTEISYSSLQSPKLIRGFASTKNGGGGHQFGLDQFGDGVGSFRVSHQIHHCNLSLNCNSWQSRSENSSVPLWKRWQGPALGMEPKWGCCDHISRCVFWACDFLNLYTKKWTGKWNVMSFTFFTGGCNYSVFEVRKLPRLRY